MCQQRGDSLSIDSKNSSGVVVHAEFSSGIYRLLVFFQKRVMWCGCDELGRVTSWPIRIRKRPWVFVSSFPKRLYSFLPVKTTTKSESYVLSSGNAVVWMWLKPSNKSTQHSTMKMCKSDKLLRTQIKDYLSLWWIKAHTISQTVEASFNTPQDGWQNSEGATTIPGFSSLLKAYSTTMSSVKRKDDLDDRYESKTLHYYLFSITLSFPRLCHFHFTFSPWQETFKPLPSTYCLSPPAVSTDLTHP